MTKKETLDLGGGRILDVEVGTPEECEDASYVVCATVSCFADDLHTTCAFCQMPIVHRPYAPKTPPKICCRCWLRVLSNKGELTMKVTLESTTKIVELTLDGQTLPARVWEGVTANGVRCHAYITRIAVAPDLDATEFEKDLQEHRRASPAVEAIPLRLIL